MNNIELGPIRPPSEAQSLLIRVTRGCHWNKCFFCDLYKGMRFSVRPTEDILADISASAEYYGAKTDVFESCFLQDGDALNIPTDDLLMILNAIKAKFPSLRTITSYARCDSILKKSEPELTALREAGLNHLYRGIETGSDAILKKINKGITASDIVSSGLMCKRAKIALSEFTLLGIGGRELAEENAIETANVINAVNPEFIRVHHTAFKPNTKLGHDIEKGLFDLQSEKEIVKEQRLFIEWLDNIDIAFPFDISPQTSPKRRWSVRRFGSQMASQTWKCYSYYVNEHIVNLLLEARGKLPEAKEGMLAIIDQYLSMSDDDKLNFAVGRRIGRYYYLTDMRDSNKKAFVAQHINNLRNELRTVDFNKVCNDYRAQMI